MTSHRMQSVGRELQEQIAEILRTEIDDPLIGFATITDVEMSPDLKHARVYVSVLGDEQHKRDTMRGIRRAGKFIRGQIAERMELRYVPELRFELDETAERAQRIEQLLREEAAELHLEEPHDDGP
ncbi:MAG: 30S ribosome-binding factor RbfA [Armatimonadota bacterium]